MAEDEKVGLHNLEPPAGARGRKKRVGRGPGSGHGKTAGRGHKGQKARTGGQIPPWFEGGQMPLYRRIPKRGFTSRGRIEFQIVNVGDLEAIEEATVDPDVLRARGLIGRGERPVKVLGDGELTRAVTVRAHAFSAGAREKIEAAGGRAERIEG